MASVPISNYEERVVAGVPVYHYIDGPLRGKYSVVSAGDEVIFSSEQEAREFIMVGA